MTTGIISDPVSYGWCLYRHEKNKLEATCEVKLEQNGTKDKDLGGS
jgi:hypothetical protein